MRAQTYRPRVQNGPIAKRRNRPATKKVSERTSTARRASSRARRGQVERRTGSRVLWSLMLIGALVAAGFLSALNSQISTYRLGQAEAELKAELDEIANRQRFDILEQQRALSPGESDRAARQMGLVQPSLRPAAAVKNQVVNQTPKTRKGGSNLSVVGGKRTWRRGDGRIESSIAQSPRRPVSTSTRLFAEPSRAEIINGR